MIAIVINALAGRGRAGRGKHAGDVPAVVERIREAGPVTVVDRHVPEGATAAVAVGGDGTVHHVLQQVVAQGIPLGIVPTGTGNDLAACFGLPGTPLKAADTIAEALVHGNRTTVDLARLTTPDGTEKFYGGVLAAGFDAIVNERGNRMRWPRGPRRYDVAIVLELARLRPRHYRLEVDGARRELEAVMLTVGNTSMYGVGMKICPDADPTDAELDLLWVEPISRTTLVRVKPRIYAGTHVTHPAVKQERITSIAIDSPGIVCYADGEPMAPLPVRVEIAPRALSLLG
jgi:diacylglycerol kinase (ATP)